MNDEAKGERFLKLVDDQNTIQYKIMTKLTSLITLGWNSKELQHELETLMENHSEITLEINGFDDQNS